MNSLGQRFVTGAEWGRRGEGRSPLYNESVPRVMQEPNLTGPANHPRIQEDHSQQKWTKTIFWK